MADFFCRFLDFRSPTINYKMPLIVPSNHSSHNSRITITRKRPHHPTLLSASSSEFDVISTHEHSDGSLLFRFGDPSEVAKNVETVESNAVQDKIEGEGEDESLVLEDSILENRADREVTANLDDLTNSAISSSSIIAVVEEESETSETLLESSSDTELPVLTFNGGMEDVSTPNVDIEHIEGGLSEKYEDSVHVESSILGEGSVVESDNAKVEDNTNTPEFLEKKDAEETSIDESIIGVPETAVTTDMSPVSEHKNFETETNEGGSESFDSNEIEERSLQGKMQKVLIGEGSKSDTEVLEMQSVISNGNASDAFDAEAKSPTMEDEAVEFVSESFASKEIEEQNLQAEMQKILIGEGSKSDIEALEMQSEMSIGNSSDASDTETKFPKMEAETVEFVSESFDSKEIEEQNVQGEMQKVLVGEGSKSDFEALEMQSVMSNGNASDASDAEAKSPKMKDEAVEFVSEKDTIQLMITPHLEADSVLEEETRIETVGESTEDDVSEDQKVDGYLIEASETESTTISKSDLNDIEDLEMQSEMGNVNSSDTSEVDATPPAMEDNASGAGSEKETIQLVTMPPQLEADSVLEGERSVVSIEESREDDGSKNLKVVGGELVEAAVHEASVTESTPTRFEKQLVLSSGAALLLHPSKVLTGGEDAYFVSGETWLGVADGVGLWSFKGTNPGVYAKELIKNCERLISVNSINNPVELLNLSVAVTDSPGSSTVLIAQFDGQALHVANVGDSGFIVLRNGAIHKRSSPMNHAFHFPMLIERGDDPSSLAEFYRVDLEEDDVIITATDGLLDNLYDQDISLIVMKSLAADKKLQEIAEKLALKAQEIGSCASVRSPFGDDALAAGFSGCTRGKLDGVAVIVSLVQRQ